MESSANLLAIGASLTGFLLVASYYYYKHKFSYWERRGVKGPRPKPMVGNFLDQIFNKNRKITEVEWVKKYGKVYGLYQGVKPRLVVADAEVLREICIKNFDIFPNHHKNDFMNDYQENFLFFLQDDQWRKVRALMSPTFTSGKIKRMFKLLDHCANDLVEVFKEQCKQGKENIVDAKELYSLFTMDAIATCAYGIKLQREAGTKNIKSLA